MSYTGMNPDDVPGLDEPPGTILVGSMNKRCYLYVCQTAERMEIERDNARSHGVQDVVDFIFVLDGQKIELTYEQLKSRLTSGG